VWVEHAGGGLAYEPFDADAVAERDEELAWTIQHGRRWRVSNGELGGPSPALLADLEELAQFERPDWKKRLRDLEGEPVALEGTYGGLNAYPPAQDLAAVTGGTANVAWWTSTLYTPIPANSVLAPEAFRIAGTGRITSSATTQTLTPNANIGTAIGTGLGAGASMSLGAAAAVTNMLWFLLGDITIRAPGTAGVAIGSFVLKITNAAGASTNIIQEIFGGAATQTAIDFTVQQALSLGGTPSAAGVSVTPTQLHWMSWN
jgi:hypothetical protein